MDYGPERPLAAPPARSRYLTPGVVLVVLGLLVWLLASLVARREPRAYTDGGAPPTYVSVTAGRTYGLSIHGGLPTLQRLTDPAAPRMPTSLVCTIALRGFAPTTQVTQLETNAKATEQIASFVPAVSGQVHLSCPQAGEVYVDDADGSVDYSGVLILLATVLLTVGLPLLASGLLTNTRRYLSTAAGSTHPPNASSSS